MRYARIQTYCVVPLSEGQTKFQLKGIERSFAKQDAILAEKLLNNDLSGGFKQYSLALDPNADVKKLKEMEAELAR